MSSYIEKSSIVKTNVVYSKDMKKRYLMEISWDETKPKACIIMTYPSTADELQIDTTTKLVRNNAVNQGYGSISIVNLFCSPDILTIDKHNLSFITSASSAADIVIVAYGRGMSHTEEKEQLLLDVLSPFKFKLYSIIDSSGQPFSHPLSPRARNWNISKLN